MANCFCLKWRPDIVKALDFRHCNLFFVPDEVFEFGETLEELFLDSNDIRDLPRPLFHCQLLKKLGASDNELFTVPPAIGSLINLKELDLSKNGIVSLPVGIKGCRELELVEISVNPLGSLPDGFAELVNLTQLYLNDTLLNYLPANIGQLVKLKVLELRENKLKSLPRSMGRMTDLERLDLGQNAFQELPDVVGSLASLQELWIDNNRVTHIPRSIGNLSKLFYFDACRNRIEELPETISGWERIKDIHLSKNFIQRLPERIGQLSTLSTLRVDNNQISSLPCSVGGLVSLEELILNANDLEELPPSIGILRRLKHLNIDDNMLMLLPPELGSCSKISLLSLRGNHLETIPDEISRISSLTVANLSNNRLKYLPYNFTKLKNLQALWLSENQSNPLIPLQTEMNEATGTRVLTCYLLPQQPLDDVEYDDDDNDSFHMSVWSQQRRERMKIAFDVSESEPESSPVKKHAYPKESFRPRYRGGPYSHLSNGSVPTRHDGVSLSQERILGRRELADEGSVVGSVRSTRPRSPDSSVISDTHALFKADKERRAKDRERLRRSSAKDTKDDLQLQWELPRTTPASLKGRKRRGSSRIVIKDRNSHSDTEAMDSHPMRVRSPKSAKKRSSGQRGDEAHREVAQLTDSFRRAFTTERENQTDTELFTKNDMPEVVFQPDSSKHSLVSHSASMDFNTRRLAGQGVRDGGPGMGAVEGRAMDRSSPAMSHAGMANRLTPDGHSTDSVQSDASICNVGIPQGASRRGAGRPASQRNIGSTDPQKSASRTKRRSSGMSDTLIRSGMSQLESHPYIGTPSMSHQVPDSAIENSTAPVPNKNLSEGGVGNQRSASSAQRRSSGISDSLAKSGMSQLESHSYCGTPSLSYQEQNSVVENSTLPVPYCGTPSLPYQEQNSVVENSTLPAPRQNLSAGVVGNQRSASLLVKKRSSGKGDSLAGAHNSLNQHQGRDSGISGVSVQSGPVTDPEIDRLYAMRYQRVPPGPYHGGYDPEEPTNPLSEHTGGNQGRSDGYRGVYGVGRGSRIDGGQNRIRQGGTVAEEAPDTLGPGPSARGKSEDPRRWRDDEPESGQQWGYNVEMETATRLPDEPGEVDVDYEWGRGDTSTPTPSTGGRNTQSLVHMSRSHPRAGEHAVVARQGQGGHKQWQQQGSPQHSPWNTAESPSRPQTGELRTGNPASGDYSAQLREASGRLMSQAESRPYTGTPSQFYQEPPSAIENSSVKGARRLLRFSSENQTIADRSRLLEQSQNQPGVGTSRDYPPEKDPRPSRTVSGNSNGLGDFGGSTLNGPTHGMTNGSAHRMNDGGPLSQTSHRQSDQLGGSRSVESQPYTGTPSLLYQNQSSAIKNTGGKDARRHLRFSSENQTIVDRSRLIEQSQDPRGSDRLGHSHPVEGPLPNRTVLAANAGSTVIFGESTLNAPTLSLSLHGSASNSAHTTSNPQGSHFQTSYRGPERPSGDPNYQERAVDVPPEFIAADKERNRLSQIPTPSFQQFQDITPLNYSTPHPNRNISRISSGRPFSSLRLSRSLPAHPEGLDQEFVGVTGNGLSAISGREGRDSGIMWAVPSWVNGDDEENYVTDVNSNVSKDAIGRGRELPESRGAGTERWSSGGVRPGNSLAASQGVVTQHDVPPDCAEQAHGGPASRRANVNKHTWESHLVDHIQKRRQFNGVPFSPMQSGDNSQFHHRPSTPSQPLYQQALRNSNTMPPSVPRRALPGVPPEAGDEDTRRVTPPGSSGSSTVDSFPKSAPTSCTARGAQYGYQQRGNPRMYQATPVAPQRTTPGQKRVVTTQQRTLPDGDKSQWF